MRTQNLRSHLIFCVLNSFLQLTNILLTEDMEPKLSDFGLAKTLQMEETKVFTDVGGTIGYMDPEYINTLQAYLRASDIYSFGVVVLQLLSGRKVIELDIVPRDSLTKKVNSGIYFSESYPCYTEQELGKSISELFSPLLPEVFDAPNLVSVLVSRPKMHRPSASPRRQSSRRRLVPILERPLTPAGYLVSSSTCLFAIRRAAAAPGMRERRAPHCRALAR
uniref:Protein kinase domain-containing protein n=1 Tax=Aegilops tauschii subsp. strangulata TaxID=200361 RepID=A0A453BBI5_AEGTS